MCTSQRHLLAIKAFGPRPRINLQPTARGRARASSGPRLGRACAHAARLHLRVVVHGAVFSCWLGLSHLAPTGSRGPGHHRRVHRRLSRYRWSAQAQDLRSSRARHYCMYCRCLPTCSCTPNLLPGGARLSVGSTWLLLTPRHTIEDWSIRACLGCSAAWTRAAFLLYCSLAFRYMATVPVEGKLS